MKNAGRRGLQRLFNLFGLSTADQVLSALSNFVVSLAVARTGGAEALGRYAVVYSVYILILGAVRSMVSEPMLASPRGDDSRRVLGASTTATAVIGLGAAVPVAVVGWVIGRPELLVLALGVPVVLVQDAWRYQSFWLQRPGAAVLLDGGWVLGALVAWPIIAHHRGAGVAVLCWAGACALGMVIATPALRAAMVGVRPALSWWQRDARAMAGPLVADSVLLAVAGQAAIFVLALVTGSEAVGVLRAAQVCFMPIALTVTGCAAFAVPHLAQRPDSVSVNLAMRISGGLAIFALVGSTVTVVAAPVLHDVLYARAVALPPEVLIPVAAYVVASAAATGYVIVAKVRRRSGLLASGRLSSAVVGLSVLVPAAMWWGVRGAAWALVAQGLVYLGHLASRTSRELTPQVRPTQQHAVPTASVTTPGEELG